MKDLKNLKGAKVISKVEQKAIKGGVRPEGGKPEICCCEIVPVLCYYPTHCATGPDGTSICVL